METGFVKAAVGIRKPICWACATDVRGCQGASSPFLQFQRGLAPCFWVSIFFKFHAQEQGARSNNFLILSCCSLAPAQCLRQLLTRRGVELRHWSTGLRRVLDCAIPVARPGAPLIL